MHTYIHAHIHTHTHTHTHTHLIYVQLNVISSPESLCCSDLMKHIAPNQLNTLHWKQHILQREREGGRERERVRVRNCSLISALHQHSGSSV